MALNLRLEEHLQSRHTARDDLDGTYQAIMIQAVLVEFLHQFIQRVISHHDCGKSRSDLQDGVVNDILHILELTFGRRDDALRQVLLCTGLPLQRDERSFSLVWSTTSSTVFAISFRKDCKVASLAICCAPAVCSICASLSSKRNIDLVTSACVTDVIASHAPLPCKRDNNF